MISKIIVALDGSEQSIRAAETAIGLAKVTGALTYVVYVVDGTTSKADILDTWNSLGIIEKRKRKMKMIEKKAKSEGIQYEVKILRGAPSSSIVKFSMDIKADLLVIGSRGLNQFQRMILGSVSHKVVKQATCPVLIVK
ncbi:universal stress protein family [Halalkalibacter wakoensis JCM 9140]|uniref:Universal stress protein family n=1 Tax=Halalkalibacter wakoensis JCM 9140 TaxID=1236970 RepID=W4Q3C0_9BACI|nr:universal stress protein [Halalkalibacter wakoensis]GAE26425.1 universal stress protein family [Halalkalibacter wakoensis JCM 9140]